MIEARKKQYRNNGVSYYRVGVLITDGSRRESDAVVEQAAQRIKDEGKQEARCLLCR